MDRCVSVADISVKQLVALLMAANESCFSDVEKQHPTAWCWILHCVSKKGHHPTTNYNFNSSCPIRL